MTDQNLADRFAALTKHLVRLRESGRLTDFDCDYLIDRLFQLSYDVDSYQHALVYQAATRPTFPN